MKKRTLKPSSETQLQHWIEKLKASNVEYDLVTKNDNTLLEVDEQDANKILGIEPEKKIPWYNYLFIFVLLTVFVGWCNSGSDEDIEQPKVEIKYTPAQRDSLARIDSIKSQFSTWDGSHNAIAKLVKNSLHDPGSYKHVQTNYWDMKDHLVIKMKYRANNAFGAKVLQGVYAKVGIDGRILEIEQE